MLQFRCWYCNKRYAVADERAGERLTCTCRERLRVPRRSGGSSRDRRLADWCVEFAVYGGGGALLGFLVAVVIVSRLGLLGRFGLGPYGGRAALIALLTALGFLAGGLGGERGVGWLGSKIRRYEPRS
jgi:hypothetical protein